MNAVEITGVEKRYQDLRALDGVSLAIDQGEFFALLGPNGAGKTTLISALAGLLRVDAGALRVMGHDVVKDYRQARHALGIVPQEIVYDPFFSVRETLQFQAGYFGIARSQKLDNWIDELLSNLALSDKADNNMRQLSGGMKRRVLVAQALVHRPPVIVLDEPTAGVDVELRQTLWAFIRKLNSQGHTILLTTHYLEEAQQLCTRIAMMKAGKIVALDRMDNLLNAFSERVLKVRLVNELPAGLLSQRLKHSGADERGVAVAQEDARESAWHHFAIREYADVEKTLAALRNGGAVIAKMEVTEPDLEEVFLKVMKR